MERDLNRAAEEFLSTGGQRLSGKELKTLAASRDGQTVRKMLEKNDFQDAFKRGDADAVKNTLLEVAGTEEGSRLLEKLRALIGQ